MIDRDIQIEDLVRRHPFAVDVLMRHGIRCIRCGEPIWGTLEEAARDKELSDEALEAALAELRLRAAEGTP